MSSSAEIYTKEVHDQLQRYANWLPTEKVKVGDVGTLRNNIFNREGNLKENFGINFSVVKDPAADASYKFMSAGISENQVSVGAGGQVSNAIVAKVDLKIGFGKENSVYFYLTNCVGNAIENQLKLRRDILERVKTKDWKLDYVVVTRTVNAGSAMIAQAKSRNASLILEGTGNASALDLLNAGAAVRVKSQNSVGFSVIAKGQLTPLLTLGKVDYGIVDAVLGREGTFSTTNVGTARIGLGRLRQMVASNPRIEFASEPGAEPDYEELNISLPNYGKHIDIDNLVDFAVDAGAELPIQMESGKEISSLDLCNMRIRSRRIRSLIDEVDDIELESAPDDSDYSYLNVRLPKSGKTVDIKPLVHFAIEALEPSPTLKAEFTFREID